MPQNQGNPKCERCRGRGGYMIGGKWHRCSCTRPNKEATDLLRKANQRDDQPYKSLSERIVDMDRSVS